MAERTLGKCMLALGSITRLRTIPERDNEPDCNSSYG